MRRLFIYLFFFAILFLSFLPFLNSAKAQVAITSPLKWNTIEELINAIINFLFIVVLALGGIMIVIAGYYFVTAGGDPQKVSTAKKIILYTLIGIGIVVFSKAIMSILRLVLGIR